MTSTPVDARALWHGLEAVNAVAYFSPECLDASTALGLRGFWMGYFASRAAPLGPVGPGVVEATFFNFHPDRVRRAIPDAWVRVDPDAVVTVRAGAAASALRRLLPDGRAESLATETLPLLRRAIDRGAPGGRPLFAANRDVDGPDDPVAALWQAATTLREHRGDGHVDLLAGDGLDGCEVHVLAVACTAGDGALYRTSRGWSDDDWSDAVARLSSRGLVTDQAAATDDGCELHASIERRTDELAAVPYTALDEAERGRLGELLRAAAGEIARGGDIRFPNPMGLPALDPLP